MAISTEFAAFVVDQLAAMGELEVKRMFGGAGLYRDGAMFALIADDTLYLKGDAALQPEYAAQGMAPFLPFGAGRMAMPYYEVGAELLEDRRALADWAAKALAAAQRTAAAKPARRRRSRR
jgi:DNA transformation protein